MQRNTQNPTLWTHSRIHAKTDLCTHSFTGGYRTREREPGGGGGEWERKGADTERLAILDKIVAKTKFIKGRVRPLMFER
jgi:hypothetical protein